MSLCKSGLLIGALSVGLVITDMYHGRIDYAGEHFVLGGIVTFLFFALCHYGYEMVNWGLLLVVPLFIFLTLVARLFQGVRDNKEEDYDDECEVCEKPKRSCGCHQIRREPVENTGCDYKINCPANPLSLGTKCGVSRAT
jgi:hypothetical protein